MATKKKKPASRAAAKAGAQKKSPAEQSRRQISCAKKRCQRAGGRTSAPAKQARPRQRVAVSHHREEDFKAEGFAPRQIPRPRHCGRQQRAGAGACDPPDRAMQPGEVSKLHFHDVEFQMVYVLKGWVKTYMEGRGETLMNEGSAWTQPPRIKHLIMDYSDDVELLEVILPAEFKTVELAA